MEGAGCALTCPMSILKPRVGGEQRLKDIATLFHKNKHLFWRHGLFGALNRFHAKL